MTWTTANAQRSRLKEIRTCGVFPTLEAVSLDCVPAQDAGALEGKALAVERFDRGAGGESIHKFALCQPLVRHTRLSVKIQRDTTVRMT